MPLSTPHLSKLIACLENPRLPECDREKFKEARSRYDSWIAGMEAIPRGSPDAVHRLVELTNSYKRFIELDLIFDSRDNFLYRQKGQLKLDNTILEEFLPHLFYRSLRGLDASFEFGPMRTFAGLSFVSTIGNPGPGGEPALRSKNQDFVLGKKLFIKTSFTAAFTESNLVQSTLGYVCIECKTNLDKTMFQEAVATSRDLKVAVPGSLYFLVCEFLDMTPISITSTLIDDVLIVRKARRMGSDVRQEYRTPEQRRQFRPDYVTFLENSRFFPEVFNRMVTKIQKFIDAADPELDHVLQQGFF